MGGAAVQNAVYASVGEVLESIPGHGHERAILLRARVRYLGLEAHEHIRCMRPTVYLRGNWVPITAHSRRIDFFPVTTAISISKRQQWEYNHSRSSVQFGPEALSPLALVIEDKQVSFKTVPKTR
jgi:hypothetical protein